jgi:hypothetical protein
MKMKQDQSEDARQQRFDNSQAMYTGQKLQAGDCPGCGTEYPHCDCWRYENNEALAAEADAMEGCITAWEIIG